MTGSDDVPIATLPGGGAMPVLGLGTWQIDGDQGYRAVRAALDNGYRHIDTATMYGNEAEVGRAVRDSGLDRADVFITTKLPPSRAGAVRRTLDESLRALGTPYVDLWLVHWPPAGDASPQTWQEFLAARDAGLTRAVGVSNYSTVQIDELIKTSGEAPAVNQIPWGPSLHDAATLDDAAQRGIVVEGYSPFKNTDLRNGVLTRIASALGVTAAQVVLRWHVQHGVVVIPKSQTPERIAANMDIFGFTLTDRQMGEIDGLGRNR